MKVLVINTTDTRGGAGIIAFSIIQKISHNYKTEQLFLVSEKYSDDSHVVHTRPKWLWFIEKSFSKIMSLMGLQYLTIPFSSQKIIKIAQRFNPDIIHIHNVHGGYMDYHLLKKLFKMAPIIWTFHDMFPFTGHCAHSFECDKWISGCGHCPDLNIPPAIKFDTTGSLWKYKKSVYDDIDFTITTPSKWLFDCVGKSMLNSKRHELIYNGIDLNIFNKKDKIDARKILSFPMNKKIILFSANSGFKNPFKGGNYVLDIFQAFKNREDLLFLNIGGGDKTQVSENWIDYGFVKETSELALLYSAADVFLYPTLAESFGLVVAEAMACGLPVLTFSTGGVPELVEHKKTGYIAEYKNIEDLKNGLIFLLENDSVRSEMSERSRNKATEMFDEERMVEQYYELYLDVIKEGRK